VIGDALEGNALSVLSWNSETNQVEFQSQTTLDQENADNGGADTVFEGLGPMWADINDDGHDDLVTTVSNSNVGARLRIYQTDGLEILAQAPPIGTGGRWLHQLAVGQLGPNGETEIVEIRLPHVGGVVQYYRYINEDNIGELKMVASTSAYTSHDIRTRNFDRAVVADFNGDGIPELAVQNQAKDALMGLQRTVGGVEEVWAVSLSSPVHSNIGVSCSRSGIREISFGTEANDFVRLQFVPHNITVVHNIEESHEEGVTESGVEATSNESGTATSGARKMLAGFSFLLWAAFVHVDLS